MVTKAPPANINVSFEREQIFSCEFVAPNDDPVKVSWTVDGLPPPCHYEILNQSRMEDGQLVTTSNLSATFIGKPLSGQYVCMAENGRSTARALFNVHVQGESNVS